MFLNTRVIFILVHMYKMTQGKFLYAVLHNGAKSAANDSELTRSMNNTAAFPSEKIEQQ